MNTDRFETIHLADRRVLVDKEAEIIEGKYPLIVVEKLTTGEWQLWQIDNANDIDKKNQIVVIGSYPKIGNIPLLPEMDDEVVKLAAKEYPVTPFYDGDKFPYYDTNYDLRTGYAKGFKAAKELYPFSKQDIIKAMMYAESSSRLTGKYSSEDFINSLKPQFIPEIEVKSYDEQSINFKEFAKKMYQPKIDKQTNTLIGKWV